MHKEELLFLELKSHLDALSKIWHGINNPTRAKAYYKAIRGVPAENWPSIFDGFLDNASKMPLPADFRAAASAFFRRTPKATKEALVDHTPPCVDCYGTGFLFAKRSAQEADQYLCVCHCDHGLAQERHYKKTIQFIPRWDVDKMESIFGFVKCPFPHALFIPRSKRIDSVDESDFSKIVTRWRSKIKTSNEYWSK